MAVALLVIGWVTLFSAEFHRSGERPGHLPARAHPPAGRPGRAGRAAAPGHRCLAAGDAALPGRVRRPGRRRPGRGPAGPGRGTPASRPSCWRWSPRCCSARPRGGFPPDEPTSRTGRTGPAGPAGLGGHHRRGRADRRRGHRRGHRQRPGRGPRYPGPPCWWRAELAVLVLAVRAFMLARQNGTILGIWRESSRSLRELASRTNDVVLVCDLDGVISYASPAVGDYGYAPGDLSGRRLLDYVHPEDRGAALAACRRALGASLAQDRPVRPPRPPPHRTRPHRTSRPRGAGRPPGGSRPGCAPPTAPGGTSSRPCCATRPLAQPTRSWSPPATSATRWRCASRSRT